MLFHVIFKSIVTHIGTQFINNVMLTSNMYNFILFIEFNVFDSIIGEYL